MSCLSVMIRLLFAVWSLFPSISNAESMSGSEKSMTKPGHLQKTFSTVFMSNSNGGANTSFQLYLVTCDKAATVTVTVSQPFFTKTVHVPQDSSNMVTLDETYMITEENITSKVIMVTSNVPISVFAFSYVMATTDATTCLPLEDLGRKYFITTPERGGAQFSVVNVVEPEARVDITVSGSITYNGISYKTGDSFKLLLRNQQVIQFQSFDDLTGTKVSSSAPVAVIAGSRCYAGINSTCDTLMDQLHPVKSWGNIFAVFPFFNHTQDVITIVAGSPDTRVTIDSPGGATRHSLQEGAHVRMTVDKILLINATKPVMVSYLFHETRSPSLKYTYDPFLTTVPPSLMGKRYYKFVTWSSYDNFILIVSQVSSDSEFYLDGKPLSYYPTTRKEFNGFIGQQVTLGKTEGHHEIYHETSTFTLYVFGTESFVSYGYSMSQGVQCSALPRCSIRCLPDAAEYILPYSLVSGAHLDVLDIHLKDPLCRAKKEKDHYLIKIPFNRCGSSVLYEDEKTFYANTIYGTVPDTDVHRIEIPVKCEMESNKSLELVIKPQVKNVICKGYYNVSMRLYQSEGFTDPITLYPHEVDLHSNLHVELVVESVDEELRIFTESITASPSLEDTNKRYNIIHHGCRQDSTLQDHPVTDRRRQRLSFHVVKFDHFHEVYLSANVIICHNSTSPNRCTQGCITPRLRRDVRTSGEELDTARLSEGPIVFRAKEKTRQSQIYNLTSVLLVVLCVTVILAAVGLAIQREYYRRQQKAPIHSSTSCS
ncbi:IgGFc-binding protein-like [Ranitomeya imitator]|uniref:IgGFc-binding protein-like n=1 Tax=Ranitomeya imitator TaxID=111125 RepID=UPI0037E89B0B